MHLDGSPGPLIRSFGRRGVFLMMFGVMYLFVGASSLLVPTARFHAIPIMGPFLDSPAWGLMWIIGGIAAMAIGFLRKRSRRDELGFMALLAPPGVWTVFYATSAVCYVATGGEYGRLNSISGLCVWLLVWLVVTLVSGWPDADSSSTERR